LQLEFFQKEKRSTESNRLWRLLKADSWAFQLVPEGVERVRMLRIRRRTVLGVAAGIAVLAIAGLVGLAFATGQAARQLEILRLRTENRLLASSVEALDERAGALDEALDDLAVREERFRLLAGLPLLDPEIQEVGVGGPAPIDNEREEFFRLRPDLAQETYGTRYELDRMLRRAKLLEAGLAEAEDSLAFSHEALLARPSIWPVAGQEAWLSSGFARSRLHPLLLKRRPHLGLDVSSPRGAPVVATARGMVVTVGKEAAAGRVVEIDHGFGYVTRYAHLFEWKVREGQKVERGEVIGSVGKTGLATAPHVHYEIHVEGSPVNPYDYLLERHRIGSAE
jgi:murein DD-endopeptidase MepM/ murein hydrolase activator NlpD